MSKRATPPACPAWLDPIPMPDPPARPDRARREAAFGYTLLRRGAIRLDRPAHQRPAPVPERDDDEDAEARLVALLAQIREDLERERMEAE